MKRNLILLLIAFFCFVAGYAQQTITPETALKAYLNNNDPTGMGNSQCTSDRQYKSIFFVVYLPEMAWDLMEA